MKIAARRFILATSAPASLASRGGLVALLASSVVAVAGMTACNVHHGEDPPEIAARYESRWLEPCSSWLYSPNTGLRYCASPEIVLAKVAPVVPAAPAVDPDLAQYDDLLAKGDQAALTAMLVKKGEKTYASICAACHQANGEGLEGVYPPLKGAGSFYGEPQYHAGIIIHGLNGEIEVLGKKYNNVMMSFGAQYSDLEIAAVATYERNSWGNADGIVTVADVVAARAVQ